MTNIYEKTSGILITSKMDSKKCYKEENKLVTYVDSQIFEK